jgi:hypothetical protein
MRIQKDDGGPAYPWTYMDRDSMGQEVTREQGVGMTLRDYFAAAALQGLCSSQELLERYWDNGGVSKATKECYVMADAMIAARKEES